MSVRLRGREEKTISNAENSMPTIGRHSSLPYAFPAGMSVSKTSTHLSPWLLRRPKCWRTVAPPDVPDLGDMPEKFELFGYGDVKYRVQPRPAVRRLS